MDFLFWIDLKNKMGINRLTTLVGPIFNVGQPLFLYLIKLYLYSPNIWFSNSITNIFVLALNLLYLLNMGSMYSTFLSKEKLVTGTSHGHLDWPWIKYSNPLFYLLLFAVNIFYLTDFKYSFALFSITYLFLFMSARFFSYSIGEMWCFFGAFIPFFMTFISYMI